MFSTSLRSCAIPMRRHSYTVVNLCLWDSRRPMTSLIAGVFAGARVVRICRSAELLCGSARRSALQICRCAQDLLKICRSVDLQIRCAREICMLSWWSCFVHKQLHTPQTNGTNGHLVCQENTCALNSHGAQFFFWELRDAYIYLHLDSYAYEQLVELIRDTNHPQTTKREAWFGTFSARCLVRKHRATTGLSFFSGSFWGLVFFYTFTLMCMIPSWS